MKAIFNTFLKSDLSHLNGLTFTCVGHNNGLLQMAVDDVIYEVAMDEVIIVDIVSEMSASAIRHDKTFCDYWYAVLRQYIKVNKIRMSIDEAPRKIADRDKEVIATFEDDSVNDSEIF